MPDLHMGSDAPGFAFLVGYSREMILMQNITEELMKSYETYLYPLFGRPAKNDNHLQNFGMHLVTHKVTS